jgi:hypothetical protein
MQVSPLELLEQIKIDVATMLRRPDVRAGIDEEATFLAVASGWQGETEARG